MFIEAEFMVKPMSGNTMNQEIERLLQELHDLSKPQFQPLKPLENPDVRPNVLPL